MLNLAIVLPPVELEQAMAWLGEAEAALRRCKKLLPDQWVRPLQHIVSLAQSEQPVVEAHLRMLRLVSEAAPMPGSSGEQREPLQGPNMFRRLMEAMDNVHQAHESARQQVPQPSHTVCDCCERLSVGVQRCGRCRRAYYCR